MQFCLWSGRPATINPVSLSRSLFSLSFFHRRTNPVWRPTLKRNLSAVRRDMRIAPWTAKKNLSGMKIEISFPRMSVSPFHPFLSPLSSSIMLVRPRSHHYRRLAASHPSFLFFFPHSLPSLCHSRLARLVSFSCFILAQTDRLAAIVNPIMLHLYREAIMSVTSSDTPPRPGHIPRAR